MTFFSIDTSSTAVLPFSSLKFIWIFLLATAFVSAAMALAWWNRTKKTRTEKQREIDTKRQKDEASERATKLLIEATQHDRQKREERLEQATLRYEEKAAVEQSLMKNDEATAEDLKRAHAEATRAISELMAVQMACA
jgi:flagellar basal body-associated protein FliL